MITVICPVYNEEKHIHNILDFFIRAQPESKELIIIDGGSTDKTKELVKGYSVRFPQIKILDNPDKYVPFALNKAIKLSEGDPVIRLDAHTKYADDYFTAILNTFSKTGADIVGGPMRSSGDTNFQKAVAFATSTSFGIGDSSFHDDQVEGYVDSVYLGAWRRNIFKDTGYFDTDMIRNQDDEFHYRASGKGKRIYLDPRIKSWYYPRATVALLYRQYYQYGLFKPMVLRKVRSGLRARHLVPSGFVGYLLILILCLNYPVFYFPLILYIFLDIYFSIRKSESMKVALRMFIVYPVLHISYGLGFIAGMITLRLGRKPVI